MVITLTPQRLASNRGIYPKEPVGRHLPSHHWILFLLPSGSWFEMAGMANEPFIKGWERTITNRQSND